MSKNLPIPLIITVLAVDIIEIKSWLTILSGPNKKKRMNTLEKDEL
ncbi:hypothetical protein [Bacillus sp. FJAT-27251]|nr:hypothetical protein [Bacillus sp. FJAT-27251]